MAAIEIAVINRSTVLSNEKVDAAIPVLQRQVHEHFAPAWGIDAGLSFVPTDKKPGEGQWWLTILDDSDRAGDLGYHELTDAGLPLAKVFAETDQSMGYEWTATASHELLEMLADPNSHLTVFVETQPYGGFLYAYEVCDPCEAEEFGYRIDGTLVSDFVFPAWFEPLRERRSTQFDQEGSIQAPFQCLPGCHVDVYDTYYGTWRTFWGEGQPYRHERWPRIDRQERRRRPRHRWWKSELRHAYGNPVSRSGRELEPDAIQQLSSSVRQLEDAITRLGI